MSCLIPEGVWSDRDIEGIGESWVYVGIVLVETEIGRAGDGIPAAA
jgi:hypothetical protein